MKKVTAPKNRVKGVIISGIIEIGRILLQSVKQRRFRFLNCWDRASLPEHIESLWIPAVFATRYRPAGVICTSSLTLFFGCHRFSSFCLTFTGPIPHALGDSHFGRPAIFFLLPVTLRPFLYICRFHSLRLCRVWLSPRVWLILQNPLMFLISYNIHSAHPSWVFLLFGL